MKVNFKTKMSGNGITIPTATDSYWFFGSKSFTVSDRTPEGEAVYDITNEMENWHEVGMDTTYYKLYAAVDGDDIEFIAVEQEGIEE